MRSQRVRHDLAPEHTCIPPRRGAYGTIDKILIVLHFRCFTGKIGIKEFVDVLKECLCIARDMVTL